MRTAITLGFKPGGAVDVLALPTVPFMSQKTAFKLLRKDGTNPTYERVEIWDSGGGRMKLARFQKPAEAAQRDPVKTYPDPRLREEAHKQDAPRAAVTQTRDEVAAARRR